MKSEWLAPLVFACACAEASSSSGAGTDANNSQRFDAGTQQDAGPRDAAVLGPDAAMADTLSETTTQTMTYGDSIACSNTSTGNTYDNTWYRAFQLSDYPEVTGGFHISTISIGVQEASAAGTITVNVDSYGGALDGSTIVPGSVLGTGTVQPGNTSGQTGETVTANVSADIPAGGKFVVEIVAPDIHSTGYFYIGATASVEQHPGYFASSKCGITTETTTAAGGIGHLIIAVVGTH